MTSLRTRHYVRLIRDAQQPRHRGLWAALAAIHVLLSVAAASAVLLAVGRLSDIDRILRTIAAEDLRTAQGSGHDWIRFPGDQPGVYTKERKEK